jgi:DegV family protein with EDD domain
MPSVTVVTDSQTDIPHELAEELGILIAPLRVSIDGRDCRDKIDISGEEIYRLLPTLNPLPTTSGVAVGDFVTRFQEGLARTGCVLCLTVTEGFSVTRKAAHLAREELGEEAIHIVDSHTAVAGQALIVIAAAKAAQEGKSKDEILALINGLIPKVDTLLIVNTLKYLYRGGRLSAPQALLGSELNVKPILRIKDDRLQSIGRERSLEKAKAHILRRMEEGVGVGAEINVAIMHAVAYQEAEVFRDEIAARFRCRDVHILDNMGPTAGTHTGPGALGVGFYAL